MEKTDRYGDQVVPSGVNFKNFLLNNVALFNHNSNSPIGKWLNVRLQDNQLLADLEFLPLGLSSRVDEIRAMAEHDILKAVSIGFMPKKQEPITINGRQTGFRYLESELCEISLVAVPALAEALAVARSLNISRGTMARVFTNGALVSEHIAQARKAVAQQHQYSATVANIERKIEALWTRIGEAATEAEQQALIKQLRSYERTVANLTPEHLRTADQKRTAQLYALAAEQARNDPWGMKARAAEVRQRSTEYVQRMEREHIARQKAQGVYVDPNPSPSSGNTVTWRGQRIDIRPTWRGKPIV
jgi:HK97 family phage prohead protease